MRARNGGENLAGVFVRCRTGAETIMIKGINAVLIQTRDVRKLAEFYRDKLGLQMNISDHGGGTHAEMDFGAFHFAIQPGGGAPVERGPVVISFQVDDVNEEYEALKSRGVVFDMAPREMPFGGILAEFRDPDGNRFYLMQWQQP